jgi:hypothetical protein
MGMGLFSVRIRAAVAAAALAMLPTACSSLTRAPSYAVAATSTEATWTEKDVVVLRVGISRRFDTFDYVELGRRELTRVGRAPGSAAVPIYSAHVIFFLENGRGAFVEDVARVSFDLSTHYPLGATSRIDDAELLPTTTRQIVLY